MDNDKVKLNVLGITYSQIQQGAYMLVLAEEGGRRRIPIVVGTAEAQSIAIRLENLIPPRPITHDLFVSLAHGYGIVLREVFIYRFEKGIFFSELLFDNGEREMRIDSRTSDAVAIALRIGAPIFTTSEILQQAGFDMSEIEQRDDDTQPSQVVDLDMLDRDTLEKRLAEAVAEEAYEEAARIQQIINKRKTK